MTELEPRLRSALDQIGDNWSPVRSERNLAGTQLRHQARQRRRALAGAAGVGVVIGVAWVVMSPPRAPEQAARAPASSAQPHTASADRHMQFEDGSQIELDPAAQLVVNEVTAERIAVRLLSGSVRVDVVPRKQRSFQVQSGSVTVEVLGTAFELTKDGERTRVSVLRGRVAVHAPEGSRQLTVGEAGWFPQAPGARGVPAGTAASREAMASPTAARQRTAARSTESGWRAQAERGNFKRAYELMPRTPAPVSNDVEALLLAADAARLSGHPAQAVPFLHQAMEQHPRDPRASLAAFTLGGVLLNQLDRPREAEAAYARARSLALSPALAQDALARQVESAQRAGDTARMRELATEYLSRYPDGRRAQWVRDTSGL